jgi:hypothetical protein
LRTAAEAACKKAQKAHTTLTEAVALDKALRETAAVAASKTATEEASLEQVRRSLLRSELKKERATVTPPATPQPTTYTRQRDGGLLGGKHALEDEQQLQPDHYHDLGGDEEGYQQGEQENDGYQIVKKARRYLRTARLHVHRQNSRDNPFNTIMSSFHDSQISSLRREREMAQERERERYADFQRERDLERMRLLSAMNFNHYM